MRKEISYNGVNFTLPMSRIETAFQKCADELEKKLPNLKHIHLSVRKDNENASGYAIDLRAVSKEADVVSTVQTRNIFKGLKIIKNATLQRLRESRKKMIDQRRRKAKKKQRDFIMDTYNQHREAS